MITLQTIISPNLIHVSEPRYLHREPHPPSVQRAKEGGFWRLRSRVEGVGQGDEAGDGSEEDLRRLPARHRCPAHLPLDLDSEAARASQHHQAPRYHSRRQQ